MSREVTSIDGAEFARSGGQVSGCFGVAELMRLSEAVDGREGTLEFDIRGSRDGEQRLYLELKVEAVLRLRCQRCLAAMEFPLSIASRIRLIEPGESWPDEELADDDCDVIETDKALSVADLVEEEVLLALPIAPRHEACSLPQAVLAQQDNPAFAQLAVLKAPRRDA